MKPTQSLRAVLVAAVLTAATGQAAHAADPSQSFLKDAIQANLSAIGVGKLAVEKGTSDAIKRYGQSLIDAGNTANSAATAAAKSLGVSAPLAPNTEQVALHDQLAKVPGKQFDTDFVNAMLQAEAKDIPSYQGAVSNDKDAAGAYAKAQLPVLQNQLSAVQAIAKSMGL